QHTLDPHGNVNLSAIETEGVLIQSVTEELKRRKFTGKFSGVPHFFGYEGRCGFPSNFDANYCYVLGLVAALLIMHRQTSMMAFVSNLTAPVAEWTIGGLPLTSQMSMEERGGKKKPLIQKTYVDLNGKPYKRLQKSWELTDDYQTPGPMQFDDSIPLILQ
ncbi:MAG TPA: diphosphate--fructose-6-phosphate 1-phosphotransferase, partial [Rhabdochlamydiaceae bacterium]|nr:diphosphate--fructose-6-phosphate 1-phosphotransferase [Rhabdochlamydiaceae bacterium]